MKLPDFPARTCRPAQSPQTREQNRGGRLNLVNAVYGRFHRCIPQQRWDYHRSSSTKPTGKTPQPWVISRGISVRVPPHLLSRSRASSRELGKSDPIDALAVARTVLREPDLPVAAHDEVSWDLRLLVDRREDLIRQRVTTINRLLVRTHELDPAWGKPLNWEARKPREANAGRLLPGPIPGPPRRLSVGQPRSTPTRFGWPAIGIAPGRKCPRSRRP